MADRTLKRPMFRRGGIANEGIMSGLQDQSGYVDESRLGLNSLVRPGYAEGDRVGFAKGEGIFNWASSDVENIKRLPSGEIDYDYYEEEDLKVPTSWGETLIPSNIIKSLHPTSLFTGGHDLPLNLYGKEEQEKAEFERERRAKELKEKQERGFFGAAPDVSEETEAGDSILNETKEVVIGDNTRASDVKAIYEDILPLLQSTMGVDDSELNRQKYLELAKFGANLMAQPGGSLTRAIGKAAEDPLGGLTRIAETKRKGKRIPAEIAMKIALSEGLSSSELGKQIKDLKKLYPRKKGESSTEYNERIGDKAMRTGATVSESRIQNNIKLLEEDLDPLPRGKAARAIDEAGLNLSYFEMWPKNEEDAVDGQHYITKTGKLKLVKGKKVLEWNPRTKKFE